MDKVLRLTIKKKWFELILKGEKKEEYREIKPYWLVRFIEWRGMAKSLKIDMCTSLKIETSAARWNFDNGYCNNRKYEYIEFKNGYSKDAPTFTAKFGGIYIGKPKGPGKDLFKEDVFCIVIGNEVSRSNCSSISCKTNCSEKSNSSNKIEKIVNP